MRSEEAKTVDATFQRFLSGSGMTGHMTAQRRQRWSVLTVRIVVAVLPLAVDSSHHYSDETILPLLETLTNKSDHGDILFGTQHGLGVCHEYTSPGDYVFLLDGVNQPLVLRPLEKAGYSSEQGTHSEYCRFRILGVCWWQRLPSWRRLEEETNAAEGADKPASHFRHKIIEVY